MAAVENLSPEDKEFLAKCEEELKDRYTEKDEEFMKVFNSETSIPPIIKSWWVPQNSGRRNDRRNNRRHHPYERHNRDYDRRDQGDRRDYDRRDNYDRRGYNDNRSYNRGGGSRYYRN
ncbi:hypothetical protein ABMA27_011650 [Loxostege sticticalis]|uniref:Uncharacterized protein n=1 Tax=Loxostege sticticalis TaxID=481309 RepID=A0ABR3IH06_LOXSC